MQQRNFQLRFKYLGFDSQQRMSKIFFLAFFIASLFFANQVKAESSCSSYAGANNAIGGLAGLTFNQGGGAFLPPQVLQSMRNGCTSPIMQFVLLNHLMNQAIQKSISLTPGQRDPYVVAREKFDYGLCMIKKSFQEGMIIALLPQISQNDDYGGSDDEQERGAAQQQALAMAQAFQRDKGCDGSANDGGAFQAIIGAIQ